MFEELLKKIADTLVNQDIPYMIIGGQALLLYGEPRLTKDIDITLGVGIEEIEKIKKVTKESNLIPLVRDINAFVKKTFVLPAQDNTGIRVDFIFSQSSYERKAINRAVEVEIKNSKAKFASVEDFIIHKVISGRPRDIEDIKTVLLKNPQIDERYIFHWLGEFDRTLEQDFSKIFKETQKSIKR